MKAMTWVLVEGQRKGDLRLDAVLSGGRDLGDISQGNPSFSWSCCLIAAIETLTKAHSNMAAYSTTPNLLMLPHF